MTHYVVIVHNAMAEIVIRRFIELNHPKEGNPSKIVVIPFKTPKETLLDTIQKSIPTELDSLTFIAEANYGSPSQEILNKPLFKYLLAFEAAKIMAFSSTPKALLLALQRHPRIEVLVNGGSPEECKNVATYLQQNAGQLDFSGRIFTARKDMISPGTRHRALTGSFIQQRFIPNPMDVLQNPSDSPASHRRARSESSIPTSFNPTWNDLMFSLPPAASTFTPFLTHYPMARATASGAGSAPSIGSESEPMDCSTGMTDDSSTASSRSRISQH